MSKHGSFVLENDDSLSKLPCGNVVSEHNPTQKNRIEVKFAIYGYNKDEVNSAMTELFD